MRGNEQGRQDMSHSSWKNARAVSVFDQRSRRAIGVIGTEWSGTIVCKVPIAITAVIRGNSGVWFSKLRQQAEKLASITRAESNRPRTVRGTS
jgi:hypothetical protein